MECSHDLFNNKANDTSLIRTTLEWMLRAHLHVVIGLENSCHLLKPVRCKIKQIATWTFVISRACR